MRLKTIFIFVLMITFFGCEDIVDVEITDQVTEDNFYQTEEELFEGLIAAYDPLQWNYLFYLYGDIASEVSFAGGASADDVPGIVAVDAFQHDANTPQMRTIWNYLYAGVRRSNLIITKVEENDVVDPSIKDQFKAEAKFLRAFYYFDLVRFFGEVPLITRIVNAGEVDFPRQPTADIYGQIEQDLTDAIPVLKNVGNVTPGRVTKEAAMAMLGKAYLYQDKFTLAAGTFDQVIGGPFDLISNYPEIFEIANENGIESVFEIPHSNESNWFDWGYIIGGDGNFSIIHNGVRGLSGGDNPFDAGWSFNVPTPEYVASFEADDPRKDASIIFEEDLIAGGSSIIEGFQHTGYYNKKYTPRKGESCCQRELNYGNNNRVIRFADVLLMGAEAHARGGGSEGVAQQYLNRVRRRAFGDTNQTGFMTIKI